MDRVRPQPRFCFIEISGGIEAVPELYATRQPGDAANACKAKEKPVTSHILHGAHRHEVDQQVRTEAANLAGKSPEFAYAARAHRIAHVAVHQTGVAKHSRGRLRFCVEGEVVEQNALRQRKQPRQQVEAGQRDDRVS